jgi:hypothetical protein
MAPGNSLVLELRTGDPTWNHQRNDAKFSFFVLSLQEIDYAKASQSLSDIKMRFQMTTLEVRKLVKELQFTLNSVFCWLLPNGLVSLPTFFSCDVTQWVFSLKLNVSWFRNPLRAPRSLVRKPCWQRCSALQVQMWIRAATLPSSSSRSSSRSPPAGESGVCARFTRTQNSRKSSWGNIMTTIRTPTIKFGQRLRRG